MLVAARKLGRPVHWMSSRSEAFLSDNHARDTFTEAELAFDEQRQVSRTARPPSWQHGRLYRRRRRQYPDHQLHALLPGMYDIAHIDIAVRCVFTNTTPTAPYRGAGRPEANYVLERVIDEAARVTGIDRGQAAQAQPDQAFGDAVQDARSAPRIDSGDFEPLFDKALALADYDGFKQRRRERAKRGKYRGLGISCMLEHAGGVPTGSDGIELPRRRDDLLGLNVQSTGQGHATVFTRLLPSDWASPPSKIHHATATPRWKSRAPRPWAPARP